VLRALVSQLESAKARAIRRTGNTIVFRGGPFRLVSAWNPLVAVTSGRVVVTGENRPVSMTYTISFAEIFWTSLALVLGAGLLGGGSDVLTPKAIGLAGFIWLLLFGGNVLLACLRFRRLLRRAAE
jgi:hypothetical protein